MVVGRIAASVAHRLTSVNMIAKTTGKSEECSGPGPRRHRRWARTAVRDQRATRAVRSTATSRASVAGLWPLVARRAGGYGGRPEGPRRERSERGVRPKRGAWAGSASGAKRERQRGGPCTHRAEHRRTTTLNARRFSQLLLFIALCPSRCSLRRVARRWDASRPMQHVRPDARGAKVRRVTEPTPSGRRLHRSATMHMSCEASLCPAMEAANRRGILRRGLGRQPQ